MIERRFFSEVRYIDTVTAKGLDMLIAEVEAVFKETGSSEVKPGRNVLVACPMGGAYFGLPCSNSKWINKQDRLSWRAALCWTLTMTTATNHSTCLPLLASLTGQ